MKYHINFMYLMIILCVIIASFIVGYFTMWGFVKLWGYIL